MPSNTFPPSSSRDSTPDSNSKRDRRVSFDSVDIREYTRVIGDNPSVSCGPALSIGWTYETHSLPITLEEYENSRGERRSRLEMAMPRHIREEILKLECGCSRADIAACVRQINHVKFQRRQTVNNLNSSKVEEKLETLQKKLGQMICARNKVDAHIREWQQNSDLLE